MDDLATRLQKAASAHCGDLDIPHDLGLRLTAVMFESDGNEETRWCDDVANCCPYCGGSGHADDVFGVCDDMPDHDAVTTLRMNFLALGKASAGWRAALEQIVREFGDIPGGHRAAVIARDDLAGSNPKE